MISVTSLLISGAGRGNKQNGNGLFIMSLVRQYWVLFQGAHAYLGIQNKTFLGTQIKTFLRLCFLEIKTCTLLNGPTS